MDGRVALYGGQGTIAQEARRNMHGAAVNGQTLVLAWTYWTALRISPWAAIQFCRTCCTGIRDPVVWSRLASDGIGGFRFSVLATGIIQGPSCSRDRRG